MKAMFEVQNETDPVQFISERCELTMLNSGRKTPRARARKRYVRVRRVLLRHPYLAGIATSTGSILLDSAIDYCMPSVWQFLTDTIRGLLM